MSKFIDLAINNPKTTISGILSFVAITCTVLMTAGFSPKVNAVLAIAAALAKAYTLAISKDHE